MRPINVSVTINFPALSALVEYLTSQRQAEIDALANQVRQLTDSLGKKTADLQSSVDDSPK